MVQPDQVMATRGPGGDRDYALYTMLISPGGMRSLFIADRLPTLKEVNIAFAHVWQGLGHEQGYLLAEVVDPVVGDVALNWRSLSAEGFQPAFRRLGSHEPYDPHHLLKRQPRKGDAKGFR